MESDASKVNDFIERLKANRKSTTFGLLEEIIRHDDLELLLDTDYLESKIDDELLFFPYSKRAEMEKELGCKVTHHVIIPLLVAFIDEAIKEYWKI